MSVLRVVFRSVGCLFTFLPMLVDLEEDRAEGLIDTALIRE